jgi:hypothetical protein
MDNLPFPAEKDCVANICTPDEEAGSGAAWGRASVSGPRFQGGWAWIPPRVMCPAAQLEVDLHHGPWKGYLQAEMQHKKPTPSITFVAEQRGPTMGDHAQALPAPQGSG